MSFPFFGEEFTFTQPDGSRLEVRGWGDQNQAVFETLDGYTVTRDPITGYYQYATVTPDQAEFLPRECGRGWPTLGTSASRRECGSAGRLPERKPN